MAQTHLELTIVFADVSGSTKLFEKHGDAVARAVIARCLDTLKAVAERHDGHVVKYIGDEAMCTFPDVVRAAAAVRGMQEDVSTLGVADIATQSLSLAIRVGMHYGAVIREANGDVFGDAVNVAARMAGQAKAGEIITTRETFDRLGENLGERSRPRGRESVRGKSDLVELIELLWEDNPDVTQVRTVLPMSRPGVLLLVSGEQKVELFRENQSTTLGRSREAGITVDESLASRIHVSIECRKGKFFLTDSSLNGTYLLHDDLRETFIRREALHLSGRGKISLGRPFKEQPVNVVEFSVLE